MAPKHASLAVPSRQRLSGKVHGRSLPRQQLGFLLCQGRNDAHVHESWIERSKSVGTFQEHLNGINRKSVGDSRDHDRMTGAQGIHHSKALSRRRVNQYEIKTVLDLTRQQHVGQPEPDVVCNLADQPTQQRCDFQNRRMSGHRVSVCSLVTLHQVTWRCRQSTCHRPCCRAISSARIVDPIWTPAPGRNHAELTSPDSRNR